MSVRLAGASLRSRISQSFQRKNEATSSRIDQAEQPLVRPEVQSTLLGSPKTYVPDKVLKVLKSQELTFMGISLSAKVCALFPPVCQIRRFTRPGMK